MNDNRHTSETRKRRIGKTKVLIGIVIALILIIPMGWYIYTLSMPELLKLICIDCYGLSLGILGIYILHRSSKAKN
jgi:hypothetical protein